MKALWDGTYLIKDIHPETHTKYEIKLINSYISAKLIKSVIHMKLSF